MYKILFFVVFFSFSCISNTVIGKTNPEKSSSNILQEELKNTVISRKEVADEIREHAVKIKEKVESSEGLRLTEELRGKKRITQARYKIKKENELKNRRIKYFRESKKSIFGYGISSESYIDWSIENIVDKEDDYVIIDLDIKNIGAAILQKKINSLMAFSPNGLKKIFYPKDNEDLAVSISYDSIDIILNLKSKDGDRFVLTGSNLYGFEGFVTFDGKKYFLYFDKEGKGVLYGKIKFNEFKFAHSGLKKYEGINVKNWFKKEYGVLVSQKKENMLLEKDFKFTNRERKETNLLEVVDEDAIPWPINNFLTLGFFKTDKIEKYTPVKMNVKEIEKGIYNKEIKNFKITLMNGLYEIYSIDNYIKTSVIPDVELNFLRIDIKNDKKHLYLVGNDVQGYKGFVKSSDRLGINFIELNEKGLGYIYNIYPKEKSYDASGFIMNRFSSFERINKNINENNISFPDYWGEEPVGMKPSNAKKALFPVFYYSSRLNYSKVEYIDNQVIDFSKIEFKDDKRKLTYSESDVVGYKKSLKELGLKLESNEELISEEEMKNKIMKAFPLGGRVNDLNYINNFLDNLISGEFLFSKKDFYRLRKEVLELKENINELLSYNSDYKAEYLNYVYEELEIISSKIEKILKAMPEINIFDEVQEDSIGFSLDDFINKKMNANNTESILNYCNKENDDYFLYEYIKIADFFPVVLNMDELLSAGSIDFTKFKLSVGNVNELFYLKSLTKTSGDLKEVLKLELSLIGEQYNYDESKIKFYINNRNISDYDLELNGIRYQLALRKNKGYLYKEKIFKYSLPCKDVITSR